MWFPSRPAPSPAPSPWRWLSLCPPCPLVLGGGAAPASQVCSHNSALPGGTWPQGIPGRLKCAISLSLCKLKPWKSSWVKIMFYAQLMPASRKEKASFLTCLQTLAQTGARPCCQRQDPGPHPCLCRPVTNARGCIRASPTQLHVTGTLLWVPLPWGQVYPLEVALCDVLLGQ